MLEPPAPTPAAPRPAAHKKSGAVSRVAPSTNAEDEVFIPPHALQKRIPHCAAKDSNPPPPAQPRPPSVSPSRSPSPDTDDTDKTPLPPPSQPRCMPSRSNFESTTAAEQLAISRMHPAKRPISQESLDEEDEHVFEEIAQAEELNAQLAKGKKGKGKQSDAKGPFKSGPIPDEAKQHAFAIRAAFEKQIQDLAAEISKAPQLLFLLVGEGPLLSRCPPTRWGAYKAWYGVHGEIKKIKDIASPQEWTKIVSTERDKYCKAKLGDKWEDPDAVATLFEPFMAWHLEKHETYVEELKLEGTFDKVVNKVQHEYMRLAETAFKYNGVHCFGFIVNLQPDHTGRTGSAMWGATPAFQRMKTDEKGVISRQIAEWETLL
ncbi:hypothetical protein DXG01_010874, partial [Tephrocybe rancida]